MKLAPIGMSVYTRVHHFRQAVEALQKNHLADQSDLYVFSDAASRKEDEPLVEEVRAFAHEISGFKSVHVIEREENFGGVKNSWLAWLEVSGKRPDGRAIYVEDDIVTAPGFLTFMNEALEFYQDDGNVISITGYCPPIRIPEDYAGDVFVLPKLIGWGMGGYKRTVEIASQRIDKQEFDRIKNKKIFTVAGEDVLSMIEMEANGELNAGDVRCMYHQAIHNKYTVYPRVSLVQNIGIDGSGVHCGASNKYDHVELWGKTDGFAFIKDPKANAEIVRENYIFYSENRFHQTLVRMSKRVGVYSVLRDIKKLLLKMLSKA